MTIMPFACGKANNVSSGGVSSLLAANE